MITVQQTRLRRNLKWITPPLLMLFLRPLRLRVLFFLLLLWAGGIPVSQAELLSVSDEFRVAQNPFLDDQAAFLAANGIHRYDRPSYDLRWSALKGAHLHEPLVSHDLVLVSGANGLHALDIESGITLWQHLAGSEVFSVSVLGSITFLPSRDGRITALRLPDGEPLWSRMLHGWLYPPVIAKGRLVIGGQSGILWGLDPSSGSVIWTQEFPNEFFYRPVIDENGQVLVTDFDGRTSAVDPTDGSLLWDVLSGTVSHPPVVVSGSLLLTTLGGDVEWRSLLNGELLHRHSIEHRIPTSPRLHGNTALVIDATGHLHFFNLADGRHQRLSPFTGEPVGQPFVSEGRAGLFLKSVSKNTAPSPVWWDETFDAPPSPEGKKMIRSKIAAAVLAASMTTGTTVTAAPFGGAEDTEYATKLWSALQAEKMVGDGAIMSTPYTGAHPHGAILDTIDGTLTLDGTTGQVIVKRNYGGDGVSKAAVADHPANFLKAVTVMYQRKGYDPDNQDWFWVKYLPDGSLDKNPDGVPLAGRVAKGASKGCIACHKAAPGGDMIYNFTR